MLRIVGGEFRGRKIIHPEKPSIRPTSHKVREAVFDILQARIDLYGIRFLDLFAGSGAVGLEALSRGAEFAELVENDPDALRAIKANALALGVENRIAVTRGSRPANRDFDAIFADPPYGTVPDFEDLVARLQGDGFLIFESESGETSPPPGLETVRTYRYGGTMLTLYQKEKSGESG